MLSHFWLTLCRKLEPQTNMKNGGRFSFCLSNKVDAFSLAGVLKGEEGPSAVQAEADQQRSVHQAEQGHHQHA